jgi:hypothetical protein
MQTWTAAWVIEGNFPTLHTVVACTAQLPHTGTSMRHASCSAWSMHVLNNGPAIFICSTTEAVAVHCLVLDAPAERPEEPVPVLNPLAQQRLPQRSCNHQATAKSKQASVLTSSNFATGVRCCIPCDSNRATVPLQLRNSWILMLARLV